MKKIIFTLCGLMIVNPVWADLCTDADLAKAYKRWFIADLVATDEQCSQVGGVPSYLCSSTENEGKFVYSPNSINTVSFGKCSKKNGVDLVMCTSGAWQNIPIRDDCCYGGFKCKTVMVYCPGKPVYLYNNILYTGGICDFSTGDGSKKSGGIGKKTGNPVLITPPEEKKFTLPDPVVGTCDCGSVCTDVSRSTQRKPQRGERVPMALSENFVAYAGVCRQDSDTTNYTGYACNSSTAGKYIYGRITTGGHGGYMYWVECDTTGADFQLLYCNGTKWQVVNQSTDTDGNGYACCKNAECKRVLSGCSDTIYAYGHDSWAKNLCPENGDGKQDGGNGNSNDADKTDSTKTGSKNDVGKNDSICPNDCCADEPLHSDVRLAMDVLNNFAAGASVSVWTNQDGKFNTTRLISDAAGGVVFGTIGGLVSNKIIKKNQVKNGMDGYHCTIADNPVADYGDEFVIGLPN